MFLVYSLLEANPKHKDFGYMDQQRAMRAFDRTDILSFMSGSDKKKKRKGKRIDRDRYFRRTLFRVV